jgi:citronellol/citronellal dehydrogenase
VARAAEHFGGLDICINNASAIALTGTLDTDMRRFDLLQQVNGRGSFLVSKFCLPHLLQRENPHILMISPPLDLAARWFAPHLAYSIAKFGMSLVALGLAEEFKGQVAVNCLWPRTLIATAAIRNIVGGEAMMRRARTPEIMADAAHLILGKPKGFSGHFLIDDTFLAGEGITDFDKYRVDPACDLQPDFFVPESSPPPVSLAAKP